jgi:hypothetical protein
MNVGESSINALDFYGLWAKVRDWLNFLFVCLFAFWNRVSPCSPGWPQTLDLPASTSQVLYYHTMLWWIFDGEKFNTPTATIREMEILVLFISKAWNTFHMKISVFKLKWSLVSTSYAHTCDEWMLSLEVAKNVCFHPWWCWLCFLSCWWQ